MQSQSDVDREIVEIQRALEDRNNLHQKLVLLQSLTREILQINATCGSSAAQSSVTSGQGISGTNSANNRSRSCSCSQGHCRRVCVPVDNSQNTGTRETSTGRSQACSMNDPSGSTLAQFRMAVNVEEDSSSLSALGYSSNNYSSNSSRQQQSSPSPRGRSNYAQRLTELTLRVLSRGFSEAEDSWLYEMNSLIRNLILENQEYRTQSSHMSPNSGCCSSGRS